MLRKNKLLIPILSLLWITKFSFGAFALDLPPQTELEKGPIQVDEAFKVSLQKTNSKFEAFFEIEPYYYLYQDKIELNNSKNGDKGITITPTFEGNPHSINDSFFGEMIIYQNQLIASFDLSKFNDNPNQLAYLSYQGCWQGGVCYPPQTIEIDLNSELKLGLTKTKFEKITWDKIVDMDTNQSYFTQILQNYSLWLIVPIFLFLGFLLAFTPCVLPTFPLIYALIIQKDKSQNESQNQTQNSSQNELQKTTKQFNIQHFYLALSFVLASALTYAFIGMMAGLFGENIQFLLQQKWITLIAILLILFLAGSMFGWYSIQLPKFFQNKVSQIIRKNKVNSFLGVALMGIFSALIITPCLAPPLAGILIFLINLGSAEVGAIALLMLGLGMGLPLILFSTSLGYLFSERGAFMVYVERIFGFLLLLVAVYLLDRLIDDSLTLLLYGIVLIALSNYLKILAKEIKQKNLIVLFKTIFFLLLLVGLLQVVGFFIGAKYASNPLAPLINQSSYKVNQSQANQKQVVTNINDLKQALNHSQKQGLSSVVKFSADWCISCKTIDKQIFEDREVIETLKTSQVIEVDITEVNDKSRELLDFFKLFGPPAIYFFNQNGELQPKLTMIGSAKKSDFLNNLNIINR